MKFKAQIFFINEGEGWWETYDQPEITTVEQASQWIKDTVERFNATLRKGETKRVTSGKIEVIGESARQHDWHKKNFVTQADHRGNFDLMKCDACGCTGRRYGLGQGGIKRSPQFKAKKWETCPGAK